MIIHAISKTITRGTVLETGIPVITEESQYFKYRSFEKPKQSQQASKYPTDPEDLCERMDILTSTIGALNPNPSAFARSMKASMYLDGRDGIRAVRAIQKHCPHVFY